MKDQRQHWNNAHQQQWLRAHSMQQTAFAEEVQATIPAQATILELGCGEGNDSLYFAQQGHAVLATDFSDVVINQNRQRLHHAGLQFKEQDLGEPLTCTDNSFNVVYARLSLHYFSNDKTQQIFAEIARVLQPGGTLHFMCKSTDDPLYGQGTLIEKDMYELAGHVRHFFSEAYAAQQLAKAGLTVVSLETGQEIIYDRISGFIKVSARKDG